MSRTRRYPSIERQTDRGPAPLAFQQERVLYLCELDPGSSIWDINTCRRMGRGLDVGKLERAVSLLIEGHAVLRTRVFLADGEARQAFDQDTRGMWVHLDRRAQMDREAVVTGCLEEICQRPISERTFEERLFQVVLVTLGADDHLLLMRIHHIIADAATVDLLWRDLARLYGDLVCDRDAWLASPPFEYSDYARWQRRYLSPEHTRDQEAYWRSRFQAEPPALDLPTDFVASPDLSFRGGLAIVEIPVAPIEAIRRQSWEQRVLLFSSLYAAFLVLLHKICQQEDLTVGVLFSGRHYCPELQELSGFFVNMTAVRSEVRGDIRFLDLVQQVHGHVDAAYTHQDYPFERLVQEVVPHRGEGRMPLVRVMFNLVSDTAPDSRFEGVGEDRWIDVATQTSAVQVDLIFDLHVGASRAEVRIEHNTDLFRTESVVRLAGSYNTLLSQLARGWEQPISTLSAVGAEERRFLLQGCNPPPVRLHAPERVDQAVEAQARIRPDAIAVVEGAEEICYRDLLRRARGLARLLRRDGVGQDEIVAIVGDRTAEMVIGQLAILLAGGAYLPIAAGSPNRRVREILADATPKALIVPNAHTDGFGFAGPVRRVAEWTAGDGEEGPLSPGTSSSSLAYVIYTSGSTGVPKGVMIEHRSVINLVTAFDYLEMGPEDRLLQTGYPSFDATTFEIWAPLCNGARLYLVGDDTLLDTRALGDFLSEHRITVLFMVPSLMNGHVETDVGIFAPLRYLICGGEVLSVKHSAVVRRAHPGLTLINAYGPTENTTYSTCYPISGWPDRTIPIGRPIPNTRAYVLDRDLNLAPLGVAGELYVAGAGLARGYLARPELTAERFVDDPFFSGERMYRTGDRVRLWPDGLIEFLGRLDRQVKIRGNRLELGEIETRALEHPELQQMVVRAVAAQDGTLGLHADYAAGAGLSPAMLRAHLAARLPAYMVPSTFARHDQLPVTPTGKIDQDALAAPAPVAPAPSALERSPASPEERLVAEIWSGLLDQPEIGVHDSFFEIGGHSLLASALAARLSEAFGVHTRIRTVFDNPTVAEQAAFIIEALERRSRHGRTA